MTQSQLQVFLDTAGRIARDFSAIPSVEGVALSGSSTGSHADMGSDIDLYIYGDAVIPLSARMALIQARSSRSEVNNQFWETGDEWLETSPEIQVDATYRTLGWIEEQLDRVLVKHEASTGYTTCFWYNILHSTILFDRNGRLQRLLDHAEQPYPEALRRAIVAKNHPLLRDLLFSAYSHQIEKAVKRNDWVSMNHRVAAFLASYFDILFAVNRLPHPGEKKLVKIVEARCQKIPADMSQQVQSILRAAGTGDEHITDYITGLVDALDEMLLSEGLLPVERIYS